MKRKSLSIASALAITAPLILAAPVHADGISPGADVGIDVGSLLLGGALGDPPPPPYAYPPPVYYAPPPRCESVAIYDEYGELAGRAATSRRDQAENSAAVMPSAAAICAAGACASPTLTGSSPPCVIPSCIAARRQTNKSDTLATVGQWRKADQWDEGADLITGKSLSPIILSYATHPRQSLSLEVLEGAAVRGLDLHVKVIDFLEKWLASKDPTTIETAEAIRLAELVSKNFDSAASLRIRLGEQRALETRDITPERNDGQGDTLGDHIAQSAPEAPRAGRDAT